MPQIGDKLYLYWDPIESFTDDEGYVLPRRCHVKYYEIRRGGWTFGVPVGATPLHDIYTDNWCVGTETYVIRGALDTGHYTRPQTVSVTMATPSDHTSEGTRDEVSLTWPGTHTDTTVDISGNLVLASGKTTGNYVSPEIDLGSVARWRLGILIGFSCENRSQTWKGTTWDDVGAGTTWEDMRSAYGSFGREQWDGAYVQELDWQGNNLYNPDPGYTLECTVYTTTGNPGSYRQHTPGEYYGRYLQFKLTLTRADTTSETPQVGTCTGTWSKPPAGSGGGTGDVVGPASSVDDRIVTFNGTTGKLIQDSGTLVSDLAQASHTHDAGDIASGILALARGGTAADTYTASQLIRMNSGGTAFESSGKVITDFADASHTHDASDVVSGTFADARIAESNVTQHEAAIDHDALLNFAANEHFTESSIDHANIQGIGSNSHPVIDSHLSASAQVHGLAAGVDVAGVAGALVSGNLVEADASGDLVDSGSATSDFAQSSHTHAAGDIVSGLLALARGGTAADLSAATALHLVRLNAGGTALEDSGKVVTDFADATHYHAGADITSGTVGLAYGGTAADLSGTSAKSVVRMNAAGTALEGGAEIDDLSNVQMGTLQDQHVLTYFAIDGKWENAEWTIPADTGDLNDVSATSPSDEDILIYDSAAGEYVPGSDLVLTSLTVNNGAVINEGGGNYDFRVEGDTETNLLFVDASADQIGIGTNAPSHKLTIQDSSNKNLRLIGSGTSGAGARINFGDGDYVYIDEDSDDYLTIHAYQRINFSVNIQGVGVNQASPTYGLDVNGTFRAVYAADFDSALTAKSTLTAQSTVDFTSATTKLRVDTGGSYSGPSGTCWIYDDGSGSVEFRYESSDGNRYGVALSPV